MHPFINELFRIGLGVPEQVTDEIIKGPVLFPVTQGALAIEAADPGAVAESNISDCGIEDGAWQLPPERFAGVAVEHEIGGCAGPALQDFKEAAILRRRRIIYRAAVVSRPVVADEGNNPGGWPERIGGFHIVDVSQHNELDLRMADLKLAGDLITEPVETITNEGFFAAGSDGQPTAAGELLIQPAALRALAPVIPIIGTDGDDPRAGLLIQQLAGAADEFIEQARSGQAELPTCSGDGFGASAVTEGKPFGMFEQIFGWGNDLAESVYARSFGRPEQSTSIRSGLFRRKEAVEAQFSAPRGMPRICGLEKSPLERRSGIDGGDRVRQFEFRERWDEFIFRPMSQPPATKEAEEFPDSELRPRLATATDQEAFGDTLNEDTLRVLCSVGRKVAERRGGGSNVDFEVWQIRVSRRSIRGRDAEFRMNPETCPRDFPEVVCE